MIVLVGVIHVLNIYDAIRGIIDTYTPDAVALELDPARLYALLHPGKGVRGALLERLLARLESDVAKRFGTTVGREMVVAYEEAVKRGVRVVLVDRPVGETIRRMREVPLGEKLRFYASLFAYPLIPKRKMTIGNMLESVDSYVEEFMRKFPGYYRVLVEERNEYMARRIREAEKYGTVVAFVGDAHMRGLAALLPDARVIRVADILMGRKG